MIKLECDKDDVITLLNHIRRLSRDKFAFNIPVELLKYTYQNHLDDYNKLLNSVANKYDTSSLVKTIEKLSEKVDSAELTPKDKIKLKENTFMTIHELLQDFYRLYEPLYNMTKQIYKGLRMDFFDSTVMNSFNFSYNGSQIDEYNKHIEDQSWFQWYLAAEDYCRVYLFKVMDAFDKVKKRTTT